MFESPINIIDFLIERLKERHVQLSGPLKSSIKRSVARQYALGDKVIDVLDAAVLKLEPMQVAPDWLLEIDRFFCQPADESFARQLRIKIPINKAQQYRNDYVAVLNLVLPMVSIELVVSMQSFDDRFLQSMELAFLSRLSVPRDVSEASRLYQTILGLPKQFAYPQFDRIHTVKQAFMAQMMFVVLVWRRADKGSALWNFQYDCLKTCPDYLLDYPDIGNMKYSSRPAFWMASVADKDFRKVLLQRGSAELHRAFGIVFEYEAQVDQASQALAVQPSQEGSEFLDRIPKGQEGLANDLIELERLLAQRFPEVLDNLQLGVGAAQIEKLNEVLHPLRLPDDVATLYLWRNATKFGSYFAGFPEWLALESALQQYNAALDLGKEFQWCRCWFTISYESHVYLLVSLSEEAKTASPIYYYDLEDGSVNVHHASVGAMVRWIIESYKQGLITFEEGDSYPEENEEAREKLRLSISPDAFSYNGNESASYDVFESSGWPEEWRRHEIRGNQLD